MKQFLVFLFFLSTISLFAQQAVDAGKKVKSNQPSTEYDRISLTYLLLDYNQGPYNDLIKQAFTSVKVTDKFDDNSTSHRFVPSPFAREEAVNAFLFNPRTGNDITNKLGDVLKNQRFTNDVVAKWFSRKDDGSFGVELMQQRGLYNASDADVKAANASKLGTARLMDAGEKLLNNSYILVFDVTDLITKDEDYNRRQQNSKTTIKRDKNGFLATVNAYLFKLDFNENINALFWQDLWAEAGEASLSSKKQAFDNFDFPIQYIFRTSCQVEASQYNPGESLAPKVQASAQELLEKLITDGANQNLFNIEQALEDFRVKTVLFGTRPITAKIGLKENLRLDQRYFVYEMEQNDAGQIVAKRKGVIRATKHITDNRQVSTGSTEPSRFYQVAGKRLDAGMLLQQRNDVGLAFSLSGSNGGVPGINARLEYNFSTLLRKNAPRMLKLYFEAGYDPSEIDLTAEGSLTTVNYQNFIHFGGGLAKEYCFLRNFRFQPFLGIGLDQVSEKDDSSLTLSTLYGRAGAMLGINLRHNLQLTGTYGTFAPFGKITNKDNTEVKVTGADEWQEGWGHKGGTMDIGLRIEF